MEHQIIAEDIAKGRSDLIKTLVQLQIFTSEVEEILDTPLEEFEKGIEEFFEEE
ncbi:MAG: hypothetical protein ACRERE_30865 [Candidatus Entotheonellia bacterium]